MGNTYLKGTKYEYLLNWLKDNRYYHWRRIDINNNGGLSREELLKAISEYRKFTSNKNKTQNKQTNNFNVSNIIWEEEYEEEYDGEGYNNLNSPFSINTKHA